MRRAGWTVGALALFAITAGLAAHALRRGRDRGGEGPKDPTYPPLDTLKRIDDDLWIVDSGPIRVMGLQLPLRMTIIRLTGGELLLHSPTRFTSKLAAEIATLGQVSHLVAPSTSHWTFVRDWQSAYPEATTWATPGLRHRFQVRRAGLRIDHDLGPSTPEAWASVLEQGMASGAGFEEIYLYHKPSRTLVLADLVQNLQPSRLSPLSRLVMRLSQATRATTALHVRLTLSLGGPGPVQAVRRMLALKPKRVVFAHGRWFEDNGAERLRQAFDWLI